MTAPLINGEAIAVDGDAVPQARPDVTVVILDGEAVVHQGSRVHLLDPLATLVWQSCDGEASVAGIAAELAEVFAAPSGRVEADVAAAVATLAALELVEIAATGPGAELDEDEEAEEDGEDVETATVELLMDPPGACASCAEKVWDFQATYLVGNRLVGVGTDRAWADAVIRAVLAEHLFVDSAVGDSPPFLAVTLRDAGVDATGAGGARPLNLLHRADTIAARSRRPDRIVRALLAHLATYENLARFGLAVVNGVVVARDGEAMIVPVPDDPIRFPRALAGHGVLVADQPVAIVDPVAGEVVVGAPGLRIHAAPLAALERETSAGAGAGAADGSAEPEPLPWGRYRLAAIGVPDPVAASTALLTFGPARDDHRDHDATFAALLELVDRVPVVAAVAPDAIAARLAAGR